MSKRDLLFTQRLAIKEEIETRGFETDDFEWGFAGWPGLERDTPILTHRATGYYAHFCFNHQWDWIAVYPCDDLPEQKIFNACDWAAQLQVCRSWLDQLGRELAARQALKVAGPVGRPT